MENTLEREYLKEANITHRKQFAQFFTPVEIAQFMSKWVLQNQNIHSILEPAFGLGVFSRAMLEIKSDISITGFDIDPMIYEKAVRYFNSIEGVTITLQDYIQSTPQVLFDGIICNPPYLKFHDYDNSTALASIKQQYNYTLSGLSNLYALFLLKSINQLNVGGRCAYIVPSEFLNSDYGVQVKRYLLQKRILNHIIIFDFEEEVFEDAITTSSIIFCTNNPNNTGVLVSLIKDMQQLSSFEESLYGEDSTFEYSKFYTYEELDPDIKWRNYYPTTIQKEYINLVPFTTFARVSRGIATGANDYFSFSHTKAISHNIPQESLRPCICHCTDITNNVFTQSMFEELERKGKNVYLFDGEKCDNSSAVQSYISLGIEKKINEKFLTASRTPWYALEKRLPPQIWVTVFNRVGLRFIRNKSNATNLTTFHSIYINENYKSFVDLLFAYLLTPTAHDIFDANRREYGNGLRKFEPNDLNKSNVLDLTIISEEDRARILQYIENITDVNESIVRRIDDIIKKYVEPKKSEDEIEYDKGINIKDIREKYPDTIVQNTIKGDNLNIDQSKNVLISLVKTDNFEFFLDGTAKTYYTGKKFPSTVHLNKLYYFMPYLKGKGIRDLYYIKVARVGTKSEMHPECGDNDFRLVFEIEFVKQLMPDYIKVKLPIWETFNDITMEKLMMIPNLQQPQLV